MGVGAAEWVGTGVRAGNGADLSPEADETEGALWGAMGRRERLGRLERSEAACCSSDFVLALAASLGASAESPLLGSIFTCCEGKGSRFLPELIAY